MTSNIHQDHQLARQDNDPSIRHQERGGSETDKCIGDLTPMATRNANPNEEASLDTQWNDLAAEQQSVHVSGEEDALIADISPVLADDNDCSEFNEIPIRYFIFDEDQVYLNRKEDPIRDKPLSGRTRPKSKPPSRLRIDTVDNSTPSDPAPEENMPGSDSPAPTKSATMMQLEKFDWSDESENVTPQEYRTGDVGRMYGVNPKAEDSLDDVADNDIESERNPNIVMDTSSAGLSNASIDTETQPCGPGDYLASKRDDFNDFLAANVDAHQEILYRRRISAALCEARRLERELDIELVELRPEDREVIREQRLASLREQQRLLNQAASPDILARIDHPANTPNEQKIVHRLSSELRRYDAEWRKSANENHAAQKELSRQYAELQREHSFLLAEIQEKNAMIAEFHQQKSQFVSLAEEANQRSERIESERDIAESLVDDLKAQLRKERQSRIEADEHITKLRQDLHARTLDTTIYDSVHGGANKDDDNGTAQLGPGIPTQSHAEPQQEPDNVSDRTSPRGDITPATATVTCPQAPANEDNGGIISHVLDADWQGSGNLDDEQNPIPASFVQGNKTPKIPNPNLSSNFPRPQPLTHPHTNSHPPPSTKSNNESGKMLADPSSNSPTSPRSDMSTSNSAFAAGGEDGKVPSKEECTKRCEKLEEELKKKEREVSRVAAAERTANARATKMSSDLEAALAKLRKLELEKSQAGLKGRSNPLRANTTAGSTASMQSEIASLKSALKAANDALKSQSQGVRDATKAELDGLISRNSELAGQLNESQAQVNASTARCNELEELYSRRLADVKSSKRALAARLDELQGEFDELRREFGEQEAGYTDLSHQVVNLTTNNKALVVNNSAQATRIADLERQLRDRPASTATLPPPPPPPPAQPAATEDVVGFKKQIQLLEDQKDLVTTRCEMLEAQLRELRQVHADADRRVSDVRTECDQLVAETRATADQLVLETRVDAARQVDRARAEADQRVGEANAAADQRIRQVRAGADRQAQESRAVVLGILPVRDFTRRFREGGGRVAAEAERRSKLMGIQAARLDSRRKRQSRKAETAEKARDRVAYWKAEFGFEKIEVDGGDLTDAVSTLWDHVPIAPGQTDDPSTREVLEVTRRIQWARRHAWEFLGGIRPEYGYDDELYSRD